MTSPHLWENAGQSVCPSLSTHSLELALTPIPSRHPCPLTPYWVQPPRAVQALSPPLSTVSPSPGEKAAFGALPPHGRGPWETAELWEPQLVGLPTSL